jgi:hypothetical protein
LVPKDLPDLAQRSASIQHACGERVTKLVRPFSGRVNSGSVKSTSDNIAHRYTLEADRRCSGPQKYSPAAGQSGTAVFQVSSDRPSDICGQG